MSRGLDWFDAFREVAPEWVIVLLGLVTQLGDVWFLGVVVGTVYLVSATRRDEAAAIFGLLLAGLSLITGLKHVFALPRPERVLVEVGALPETVHPLYQATATATGYGFPSGHALMTTVVYVSLAEYLSVGTRRQRYLGAAGLVTAVCLSRVGLGVHYLVDVVAGVAIGLVFLLLVWRLLERYPGHRGTLGFGLATGLAAVALVTSNADPDAVLLFGTTLGAFAGWQLALLAQGLQTADADRSEPAVRSLREPSSSSSRLRRSSRSSAITGPSCCSPGVARSDCSPPRSSPHPCCPVSSASTVFGDGHPRVRSSSAVAAGSRSEASGLHTKAVGSCSERRGLEYTVGQ